MVQEEMGKPRMRRVVTYDCGWEYVWWVCHGQGFKAFGRDPQEAYQSWIVGLKFMVPSHGR